MHARTMLEAVLHNMSPKARRELAKAIDPLTTATSPARSTTRSPRPTCPGGAGGSTPDPAPGRGRNSRNQGISGQHLGKGPVQGQNKPEPQKEANGVGAQLKTWKVLANLRCCPWRAGKLAKAIHVLQLREA